jgi:hypothetical protein
MKSLRDLLLIFASVSFMCVIGAGTYEHIAMVPQWSSAPPVSLSMFQGKYGVNPGAFWKLIHPVTLLLLIVALVLNWRSSRRKYILFGLSGYVAVLIATFSYFMPELIEIISTPYQEVINHDLQSRANLWEKLSIIRTIFMTILATIFLTALTKSTNTDRKGSFRGQLSPRDKPHRQVSSGTPLPHYDVQFESK